jgi:hypothetical protein
MMIREGRVASQLFRAKLRQTGNGELVQLLHGLVDAPLSLVLTRCDEDFLSAGKEKRRRRVQPETS